MAEVTKYPVDNQLGCGLMAGIFHRRSFWPRKTSVHSLPTESSNNIVKSSSNADITSKKPPTIHPKKHKSLPETAFLELSNLTKADTRRHSLVPARTSTSQSRQKNEKRRPSDVARSSTSSSSSSGGRARSSQINDYRQRRNSISDTRELSRTTMASHPHQRPDDSRALVRATSSDAMVLGHLGNLRQPGNGNAKGNNSPNSAAKTVDYLEKNIQELSLTPRTRNTFTKLGGNSLMGNILRQPSGEDQDCQALVSSSMDPEVLKNMGNDKYKKGKFEEALALYNRAISLDPTKAAYRSNRSAALIGLGRLMEAVAECKEAIRLDPCYARAHHRLATLYARLGEAEKALDHYRQSSLNTDSKEIAQAQLLQKHLNRCTEARALKEWNILLKETEFAISSGADSAPQVYAMQAEALLRLSRHQEAYTAYQNGPNFGIDACTKFFGLVVTSHYLMIGAEVYMVTGRFEDALSAAQQAARLNPGDREVGRAVKRARAVTAARLSGNLLFKASKFSEACTVYSEGLEHDPFNSILLCNRAACRSKLGQFEKAVEDCTAALNVQPNYSKARLRRAHCNANLERWEASIQDYEVLIRESPADEEVGRALFEAQVQLKKKRGEDTEDLKFGSSVVFISGNERFRHFVTSPGMSVVLFCNKASNRQVLQMMEQVCKKFPSVNFLKVEVEDHPYLAKSEGVTNLPAFKIYKNGSRVKEIPGNKSELLEKLVKLYSS
ncbi:hypothetical protein Tsubulata_023741 [Turnera subulata]|uniref:Thioredoxin domain-containing protein n=1 Tax=Turnera subulata TaxID=218843 RepID=A0A9Q0FZA2_9ROSI|nr:hypothetical protein Tsubulata_023741 [Turnera subulata]